MLNRIVQKFFGAFNLAVKHKLVRCCTGALLKTFSEVIHANAFNVLTHPVRRCFGKRLLFFQPGCECRIAIREISAQRVFQAIPHRAARLPSRLALRHERLNLAVGS